jgi:hypothetical protein
MTVETLTFNRKRQTFRLLSHILTLPAVLMLHWTPFLQASRGLQTTYPYYRNSDMYGLSGLTDEPRAAGLVDILRVVSSRSLCTSLVSQTIYISVGVGVTEN